MLGSFRAFTALATVASILVSRVDAIAKISRSGRYLYQDDGTRFYIKGIAYQEQGAVVESADNAFGEPSTFIDPLALPDACRRDLPFLQQLGVNTVRVYSVNSSLNHDDCMQTFSAAGIYTIIDLALPLNGSIDRVSPSWSTNILDQYIRTIDTFSKYDNVLAFNVGNEVVVQEATGVSPYVKAAARDIRAYLSSKSSSALVGYAAINGASTWRDALASYLTCDASGGNSDATAIDLYGLNDYEWCGDSSFESSYAGTTRNFANFNVAAYFSEFGCITSPPRLWTETQAIFSSQMSDVWSGGVAFSYFPASSVQGQFGMVTVDGNTVTTSDDFDRLRTQYNQASGPNSPARSSAATTFGSCPAESDTFAASTTIPPTPNEAACGCLQSTLSCRFTPQTSNYSAIAGELIGTACSLLGQQGGNCNDIGGNGTTGTYGRLSGCDPTVKLSFVMSQYFEINNRNPQSCSFSGNATVNSAAPSSASAANAAASSCISNPSATFTPSAPATTGGSGGSSGGGGSSNGGSSGGNNNSNGAVPLITDARALLGLGSMAAVGFASAIWVLV
ncbi:glycoside hydrolase family 72 protein [Pleurotus ostreatus PC15]|uniref:1,3-beta-glucanosyltransferase n=2 Tax=Pleurotus TaxID=5320 RepID=A0A067NTS1_PLEO1|nr:hypothetical protein CCMSSC00406_0000122 [Pleurotus cornucopiae]KDQ30390.1 glycoside hydrolase family 72 protein [Pleurotus ostreatus PC15]